MNSFSLFAQDAWQVSKKLNFNYGLRYEYSGPPHDGKDLTTFDPNVPSGLAVAGSDIANTINNTGKRSARASASPINPKRKETW